MQLYTYFRSSAAYRLRIALNLKGLDYDQVAVSLPGMAHREPGYASVNPQRLVPALVDGGRVVIQSLAAIEYLEETHPDPPLLPAEPGARAEARALAQIVACDVHPLNNLRVLKYLEERLGQDEAARQAWYGHWIAEGFEALERLLRARGAGPLLLRRRPRPRRRLPGAPGLQRAALLVPDRSLSDGHARRRGVRGPGPLRPRPPLPPARRRLNARAGGGPHTRLSVKIIPRATSRDPPPDLPPSRGEESEGRRGAAAFTPPPFQGGGREGGAPAADRHAAALAGAPQAASRSAASITSPVWSETIFRAASSISALVPRTRSRSTTTR